MKPLEIAKELYDSLIVGTKEATNKYDTTIMIVQSYVDYINVDIGRYKDVTTTFKLDSEEYKIYNSFSDSNDDKIFLEDCVMAVYRLSGGKGYTTSTLIEEIKRI